MRWGTVLVRGASMQPTLHDGDCLVVRIGGRVRPGAVVVGRFHDRPGLRVVKRALAPDSGGWLLSSDNAAAPGAVSGPGGVEAVALLRYWPLPPRVLRPRGERRASMPGRGPGSTTTRRGTR